MALGSGKVEFWMQMSLAQPVSLLARGSRSIDISGTLGNATQLLRTNGSSLIPVVENEIYCGAITERSLQRALEAGASPESELKPWIENPVKLRNYQTGSDALRMFSEVPGATVAVVVDDSNHLWGILVPSDLFPKAPVRLRPRAIGGLATPFGVYLTTGSTFAGPRPWGLVSTGAVTILFLIVGRILGVAFSHFAANFHATYNEVGFARDVLPLVFFGIFMRLAPLSGIHAAEHMTVHAIERGEPLTVDVVSRMPRIHPRCGTNLAVAALLLTGLGFSDFGLSPELQSMQVIFALVFTFVMWKRIGGFVQYWITTSPPTLKQVKMGIKSGEEILKKYAVSDLPPRNFFQWLFGSGIVHVIAGAWITGSILSLIFWAFGKGDWLVFW